MHIITYIADNFLSMAEKTGKIQKVYQAQDLSKYSLKQELIIRAAAAAFYLLMIGIGKTLRYETENQENYEAIIEAGRIPIYTFWHNRIFAGTYFFRNRGIVVMSSQSFDGELIAGFIRRLGYGVVRGSSTRGGVSSLVEMIRLMKTGIPMAFSIDGPKGPKYVAKMGANLLAKKTGNPIMPFVVESAKYWEIGSWDNLQIPKPFSKVKVIINPPIYVAKDANDTELENSRIQLQESLDELLIRGQQWRESEN